MVLITAILVQIIPNALWAQELSKGTKIRLSMRPRGKTEGVFVSLNSDSIVVANRGERRPISLHSLREIEIVIGRKTNLLKGSLLGMAAVGGLGTLAAQNEGYSEESFAYSMMVASGLVYGLGIGTFLGLVLRSDRWETVSVLPHRVGVAPQPQGGMMFAVSADFQVDHKVYLT